jgi:seryl-tRNA synthetase
MYSPNPLPQKICGFSTKGNFLIIKKIEIKDLEKIIDSFDFGRDSDPRLKEKFLEYKQELITKEKEETERKKKLEEKKENAHEDIQKAIKNLPKIEKKDLQIGKIHTGIINNIIGKIMYINISPTVV